MDGGNDMNANAKPNLRPEVFSVYNRQVAKCLTDIGELWDIPVMVQDRIKKAIEFTCKDVDKLRTRNPNGDLNGYAKHTKR